MLLVAQTPGSLRDRLQADLSDVETRFRAELLSDLACVNELVDHLSHYRGKMLRPTLVLVAEAACRPDAKEASDAHRVLATVVEMVHMATLVHDDILDEADVRRRGATINRLSGNEAAVMLGDYLISHAYHLCSSLPDPTIARSVAHTTNTVCEGELLQLANRNSWDLDERTYFEIIRRKTASLCGACCGLGATLAGADPATAGLLEQYGEKLGVAFQIVDDVLDIAGEEEMVGKTLGRDLEKGKLTLPLIRLLTASRGADRRRLLDALEAIRDDEVPESVRAERTRWVREQVVSGDALDHARRRATELVDEATGAIERGLRSSQARSLLTEMASAVLTRRF